ncbi:MAG: ribulose-phosphate 3-epimerase [Nitrospirae bacterium]|nr:ribulose-phosphate 3-epimerase [Nitrospirota bacterium]
MIKIAPSILSADFSRLGEEVKKVQSAGADLIHIDVMDGHFVPNITVGPFIVKALRKVTNLPLDVHLMISNPEKYIDEFGKAGANILTVHVETCPHLHRIIHTVKRMGIEIGVSLNPATPLTTLEHILEDLDMVLLMSVNPGWSGQDFIPQIIPKIKRLREMIDKCGYKVSIEVDGGVKVDNAHKVASAGADILVMGSAIFETKDYKETIRKVRRRLDKKG